MVLQAFFSRGFPGETKPKRRNFSSIRLRSFSADTAAWRLRSLRAFSLRVRRRRISGRRLGADMNFLLTGCSERFVAAGPVSRILSAESLQQDGHSSRPRIAARLKRPTRRLHAPSRHVSQANPRLPPYLVLLRVGFAMPAALLRQRCALTAPFHPYPVARAVYFLWHFPSSRLKSALPDVIRHTALWSSDFPLSAPESAGSDRPVQLPTDSLYSMWEARR